MNVSIELPADPLKIMGARILATPGDMAYVRKYNETAHALLNSLNAALKTIKQMRKDFDALEGAINKKKDFTRKFLIEELTLFEMRMSDRYGSSFTTKMAEAQSSIESELADTWEKIEYSADILR
jgi:hypothetical protein